MPYLKKPQKINQGKSIKREERNEIYTSNRWKKLRKSYLQQHPLCELCKEEGKVVPAVDVHHIISFLSTNDYLKRLYLAYNPDNLMALCKICHQKIHNNKKGKS